MLIDALAGTYYCELTAIMPGLPARKLGQKVDIDYTLRKVFGRDSFR